MPAGRRPKLNPDTIKQLVEAKRLGVPDKDACMLVGLSQASYYQWLEDGRTHRAEGKKSKQFEFLEAIEKAIGERKAESLLRIRRAGNGGAVIEKKTVTVTAADGTVTTTAQEKLSSPSWQADAWFLERTDPEQFSQKVRTELTGKDGGPVEVNATWAELAKKAAEERRKQEGKKP